ncbi:pyridoxal-phosphate dependent enzyme [Devriesea agamarum]|uniref:pyridoxal-phosphate dependent enzyme n=1 Tax=Devriesea agamarum TaxID=472569 RepID=UPI00071C26A8|nr:pyridoxal-phosphate dependent enzyme [Devriesea agamarum]
MTDASYQESTLPTVHDVYAAAERIAPHVHRTPVVTSRRLSQILGATVFLKCENLQRVGAFKARGAMNALMRMDQAQRARGVVAYSSGNHAQAIALAGRELGIRVTVVMPSDAPRVKREATAGYGAEVVLYERGRQSREEIGAALAERTGATVVPPFDHPDIVAGQGTAALEFFEQVHDLGERLNTLLTPLGGGGLLSGSLIVAREADPGCAVVGVEPEVADDARRSLAEGRIVKIEVPRTLADGVMTQALAPLTFDILRGAAAGVRALDAVLTVSEENIIRAMRLIADTTKLIVEPTGALGIAALLEHPEWCAGQKVGAVLSGGNTDLTAYGRLLMQ